MVRGGSTNSSRGVRAGILQGGGGGGVSVLKKASPLECSY